MIIFVLRTALVVLTRSWREEQISPELFIFSLRRRTSSCDGDVRNVDGEGLEGVSLFAVAVAPALVAFTDFFSERERKRETHRQTYEGGGGRESEVSCSLTATLSLIVHSTRWHACVRVRNGCVRIPVTSNETQQNHEKIKCHHD